MAAPKKAAAPKARPSPLRPLISPAEKEQQATYTKAVMAFNRGRYGDAQRMLKKVKAGPDLNLRHHARVYLKIAEQRASVSRVVLKTADENYHYGIQLVNDRQLEDAEPYLRKALKLSKGAAHVHYALAVLAAVQDDPDSAYESLQAAVERDDNYRLMALSDSDLTMVSADPRIARVMRGEL
jgi:tetratricopeptide (TPR) repeat protein